MRFEVRCGECRELVASFTVPGARSKAILSAARRHRCRVPRVGVKLCVSCRREIREFDTSCPYCGAENLLLPE